MTADSFKQRLLELALALREDAADAFAGDADGTCDRCGRSGFEPDGLETDTVVEYYALVCPDPDCDGEVTFAHLFVAAGDGPRLVERAFAGVGCTNDGCHPAAHLEASLIEDTRPFRRLEYYLPVAGLLETPVRQRPVDGDAGLTRALCRACHVRMRDDESPTGDRTHPEPADPEPAESETAESEPQAPSPR